MYDRETAEVSSTRLTRYGTHSLTRHQRRPELCGQLRLGGVGVVSDVGGNHLLGLACMRRRRGETDRERDRETETDRETDRGRKGSISPHSTAQRSSNTRYNFLLLSPYLYVCLRVCLCLVSVYLSVCQSLCVCQSVWV
mgnify:CR=1 FL=1